MKYKDFVDAYGNPPVVQWDQVSRQHLNECQNACEPYIKPPRVTECNTLCRILQMATKYAYVAENG